MPPKTATPPGQGAFSFASRTPRRATGLAARDADAPQFTFYLGTHKWRWLFDEDFAGVPLFISYRQLREAQDHRAELRPATTRWCLDSGGFMELSEHGKWTFTARRYAEGVRRFAAEIGGLEWAAIMDWMTEACVLERTGESLWEHQLRTVQSLIELRSIAPEIPWAPVLQGWAAGDHMRHIDDYARRGIDLWREPVVCVGSMCRRSQTDRAGLIMGELADLGLPLHALGFKTDGLTQPSLVGDALGPLSSDAPNAYRMHPDAAAPQPEGTWVPLWMRLLSSDSTAWSFDARATVAYAAVPPAAPGPAVVTANGSSLYQWPVADGGTFAGYVFSTSREGAEKKAAKKYGVAVVGDAAPVLADSPEGRRFLARPGPQLGPMLGCTHASCNNCSRYALSWLGRIKNKLRAAADEYLPMNGPPPYRFPLPTIR